MKPACSSEGIKEGNGRGQVSRALGRGGGADGMGVWVGGVEKQSEARG